jgi:hypothetical protein
VTASITQALRREIEGGIPINRNVLVGAAISKITARPDLQSAFPHHRLLNSGTICVAAEPRLADC